MSPIDLLSSFALVVAMVVIGLLIYYRFKKLVSQVQMQSDDASNTAKDTFEDVQKLKGELTNAIENVANISNLPSETWQVASNAEKNAQKAVDAIEELQQKTDKIADQLEKLNNTKVQTDIQRAFDSIEESQQKNIEIAGQFSELKVKIDDIEAFTQKLADFVGFKAVPTPVEIFGSEVGQKLIEAGFETLESIANAEIIDIARILPHLSFNKVKELIEQAKVALESVDKADKNFCLVSLNN